MVFDIKKHNKKNLDFLEQIFPGKYFKNFMKINKFVITIIFINSDFKAYISQKLKCL